MTATPATIDPSVILVAPTASTGPGAPSVLSIYQASGVLYVTTIEPLVTGSAPFASYNLYRSINAGVSWTLVGSAGVDPAAVRTVVADPSPVLGTAALYATTIVDTAGTESAQSNTWPFVAFATAPPMTTAMAISAAALGPFPVLGSDILLDPINRVGVVGPNGDLLTVNGLNCLSQDARLRLTIDLGALALDPAFGIAPMIGQGQAQPETQAQILRSDILTALIQEPRFQSILGVNVYQRDPYSWGVKYAAVARNSEDPAGASQVFPYYQA